MRGSSLLASLLAVVGAAAQSSTCRVADVRSGNLIRCADGRDVRLLLIEPADADSASADAARRALMRLAPPHRVVTLEWDVERDDGYGITLAYVRGADGALLSERLARLGWVDLAADPPNLRYVDAVRGAVYAARRARRGMWRSSIDCTPIDERRGTCGRRH